MADTNNNNAVAPDSISKDTFEETKKLAEERATKLASAEAKLQIYEERDRKQLKAYQPGMEEMIKELLDEAPVDTKPYFNNMLDWSRTASERPNIDTQMQLGSVVHACASKLKRVREESSVQSATADQLAASAKENDLLKAELGMARQREAELTCSLKEIQTNSEILQTKLEKAGAMSEKFDFSKATSREALASTTGSNDNLLSTTDNASNGSVMTLPTYSPTDALLSFAVSHGSSASNRFMPASTNHSLLGASSSEPIFSAIRPM